MGLEALAALIFTMVITNTKQDRSARHMKVAGDRSHPPLSHVLLCLALYYCTSCGVDVLCTTSWLGIRDQLITLSNHEPAAIRQVAIHGGSWLEADFFRNQALAVVVGDVTKLVNEQRTRWALARFFNATDQQVRAEVTHRS